MTYDEKVVDPSRNGNRKQHIKQKISPHRKDTPILIRLFRKLMESEKQNSQKLWNFQSKLKTTMYSTDLLLPNDSLNAKIPSVIRVTMVPVMNLKKWKIPIYQEWKNQNNHTTVIYLSCLLWLMIKRWFQVWNRSSSVGVKCSTEN